MSRKLDAEGLVGAAEIADRLGIAQPQTVRWWKTSLCRLPSTSNRAAPSDDQVLAGHRRLGTEKRQGRLVLICFTHWG